MNNQQHIYRNNRSSGSMGAIPFPKQRNPMVATVDEDFDWFEPEDIVCFVTDEGKRISFEDMSHG